VNTFFCNETETFVGSSYWRYAVSQSPQVPASYPKPITVWGGIEGLVDDVLYVSSGYIYFFMNGTYYRYSCATAGVRAPEYILHLTELFFKWKWQNTQLNGIALVLFLG
jgi:hypothetical protein